MDKDASILNKLKISSCRLVKCIVRYCYNKEYIYLYINVF